MKNTHYPLQFTPILKDRIWGGTKLKSVLNKEIQSDITGESWELSTVENDVSVASNGALKGQDLKEIIAGDPEGILGKTVYKRFGTQFPLLFKFLDAREDLSIQVHPNDELAKARHNSFGKTEMWYIMHTDPKARIIVGFKNDSSPEEYKKHLENNSLLEILDQVEIEKGDVFFLDTGTVHAIGAGTVLAEIQQTSDITYRIYDFDRRDAMGNTRELHTELALDAINYDKVDAKIKYKKWPNTSNNIVNCPYFTTNVIPLAGVVNLIKDGSSFTVLMCVDGEFTLTTNGEDYRYKTGDTVLLPAAIRHFTIEGIATILEIYVS